MDIYLAVERAFHFVPKFSLEVAHDRVEQKKVNLVTGTFSALLSHPKAEDIQLVSTENRLEAFWVIEELARTVYERTRTFSIPVGGKEVHHVSALGQDLPVTVAKGEASFSLSGVEHCVEEVQRSFTFDGAGSKIDLSRYLSFPKNEIADLAQFAPPGVLVIPPQAHATMVVRSVLSEVIKPVKAQVINEEKVDVKVLEINFRPVYAYEYEWAAKGKKVILEFDGLTGDIHAGGKKLSDQFKGILTRDLIFDVTADAAGMLVPGGSIAVKLVKAVVDREK
jgi:hypothetical protein